MTAQIHVSLPIPTPKQAAILNSPAKRTVICAGRRAGKTTLAALIACERFLQGQKILLTSTTQDQADSFWEYITIWLADLFMHKVVYKNETRRIIKMGKGRIRVKTGSNPDVLRGGDEDLIVFDECALLHPDTWYAVGAPMLADRDGDAIFISTPNRRNWFYQLFNQALANETGDWQAWHFTTHDNPTLSQDAVGNLAADMTESIYRQEIMAEFLESDGQVFRNVRGCVYPATAKPATRTGAYVFGVDWAQIKDYTVIIVMDAKTKQVVDIDRFRGVDWALQRGRLASLYAKWPAVSILAEANSIGGPNIEALQREGLPVYSFMTTGKSKPTLIESLVLAFERNEISIPDNDILISELEAYERVVSDYTGHSRYNAPEGMHDDCVMALALAHWQANRTYLNNSGEAETFLANYRGLTSG